MTLKDRAARIIAVDRADYDFAMSIRACYEWRYQENDAVDTQWNEGLISYLAYRERMAEIDREWKQRIAQVCARYGKPVQ